MSRSVAGCRQRMREKSGAEISCGERQPPFANDRSAAFGLERVRYTSTAHDVNAKAQVLPKASKPDTIRPGASRMHLSELGRSEANPLDRRDQRPPPNKFFANGNRNLRYRGIIQHDDQYHFRAR